MAPTDSDAIFTLRHCSASLGDREVLTDISFDVHTGERIVVLGINGSGKSTLLKVLDGLLQPCSGEVSYKGRLLTPAALEDAAFHKAFRKDVGLLFQNVDAMLFCPSVRDEIAFGPAQLGMDGREARVTRWAAAFGLADMLDRPPFELSGGEKKKVALAALLAVEPAVLLLDEPTAHLNPASAAWLVDQLHALPGVTVICATHNLSLVTELGDRVIVVSKDHTLAFDGKPPDLMSDDALLIESGLAHRHLHRHLDEIHAHYHVHDQD